MAEGNSDMLKTCVFYRPPQLPEQDKKWVLNRILDSLSSGILSNGENVRKLEETVKKMYDIDRVFACSSCTQGLWIALNTAFSGVTALLSNYLAIPAYEWKSVDFITRTHLREFMDIDLKTWHHDLSQVHPHTGMFLLNHTYGSFIPEIPDKEIVISDLAHCLGGRIRDFGDIGVFSMSPTKPATSCEGGIIVTNNGSWNSILELRDKCSRMSEVNAIVGLAYLNRVGETLERKRQIVHYYKEHLPFQFQEIPYSTTWSVCNVAINSNRDDLVKKLNEKGLETRIYHESLIKGLPNTDWLYAHSFALPIYPDLDEKKVVEIIEDCICSNSNRF